MSWLVRVWGVGCGVWEYRVWWYGVWTKRYGDMEVQGVGYGIIFYGVVWGVGLGTLILNFQGEYNNYIIYKTM